MSLGAVAGDGRRRRSGGVGKVCYPCRQTLGGLLADAGILVSSPHLLAGDAAAMDRPPRPDRTDSAVRAPDAGNLVSGGGKA